MARGAMRYTNPRHLSGGGVQNATSLFDFCVHLRIYLFVILPREGQREAENMKNRRNEDDRGRDRERLRIRRALMNDDEGKRNRERNRLRQLRTQCKALKEENQKQ